VVARIPGSVIVACACVLRERIAPADVLDRKAMSRRPRRSLPRVVPADLRVRRGARIAGASGLGIASVVLVAGALAGCRPRLSEAGTAPQADACRAAKARCGAAAECCSNRCEFARGAQTGVCTATDELDGPLAVLSTAQKRTDLRLDPPTVVDASAVAGSDGQTVMQIQFAADPRLTPTLTVQTENGPLVLHDDGTAGDAKPGDRSYAAAIPVRFAALRTQERDVLADLKRRGVTHTRVFDGPELVAERAIDFTIDPARVHFLDPVPPFDAARTLVVNDLGVVEDTGRTFQPCAATGTARGTWTFGYLASQIANQPVTGIDPADLVLDWLGNWDQTQFVNGFAVDRRKTIEDVIAGWPKVAATGKLDLARAPLKLLAIVNRIDLAGNTSYGSVGGAELRFVFGVLTPTCTTKPFTVILEYGVPRRTCSALRDWALAWEALDAMAPGTATYDAALEALTEQVVHANADPGKLAGSALNQVRSDENALFPPGTEQRDWELREFTLQATAGGIRLREATVKQTPAERFNGERQGGREVDLATWINDNEAALLAGTATVPAQLPFAPGDAFLGGSTLNFFTFLNGMTHRDYWSAPGIANNDARHKMSLNTCNGCHGEETRTGFLQIQPAAFGSVAALSGFLTGETIPDPVVPATSRTFGELAARAIRLAQIAGATCGKRPGPIRAGHPSFPLPPIQHRPSLRAH